MRQRNRHFRTATSYQAPVLTSIDIQAISKGGVLRTPQTQRGTPNKAHRCSLYTVQERRTGSAFQHFKNEPQKRQFTSHQARKSQLQIAKYIETLQKDVFGKGQEQPICINIQEEEDNGGGLAERKPLMRINKMEGVLSIDTPKKRNESHRYRQVKGELADVVSCGSFKEPHQEIEKPMRKRSRTIQKAHTNLDTTEPMSRSIDLEMKLHDRKCTVEKREQSIVAEVSPSSVRPQDYEQNIQNITDDFFQQWDKMRTHKVQLYKQLRSQMAKQFPSMRKRYQPTLSNPEDEEDLSVKKEGSSLKKKGLSAKKEGLSAKKNTDHIHQNPSNIFTTNRIDQTTTGMDSEKIQIRKQERMLGEMYRQAYFWSRTKNKYISNSAQPPQEGVMEVQKMQQNLTFQKYITSRDVQNKFSRKKYHLPGTNIMNNKESILHMEKQGSRRQAILRKCLDSAIEDCR